ncbi:replicative DNA helicase, partial [Patescibacteria group bacterium]|nr:replicative DNA helicase [Patescibacteria group bacterium]
MADKLKVPPNSREVELSVLGSILIDNDAILLVSDFLKAGHFYDLNHADIYEVMLALYEDRSPIDIVTVSERLREKKLLRKIGGKAFLTRLANDVPTAANVESYGRIIKSLSAKRELISAAARISEKAFDESIKSE